MCYAICHLQIPGFVTFARIYFFPPRTMEKRFSPFLKLKIISLQKKEDENVTTIFKIEHKKGNHFLSNSEYVTE